MRRGGVPVYHVGARLRLQSEPEPDQSPIAADNSAAADNPSAREAPFLTAHVSFLCGIRQTTLLQRPRTLLFRR